MEISLVQARRHEPSDEEYELIDLRYGHAQALLKLEGMFAEGLFDR